MGIYINDDELRVMRTISPAARCAYIWLRTRMDWRTGLVGRVTSISRYALGEDQDYEVPKGRGVQLIRIADTTAAIKEAAGRLLDVLERVGLIVKRVCAVLTFFCPLATLKASVRPNQTDHKRTTPLPTEQTTPADFEEASNGAGFDGFDVEYSGERTTPENKQNSTNAPHIIGQGNTSTPQSPSTDSTGVDAGDGGAGGDYRDRPAASQAGSLRRPGNPHETPNRDRPAGSHPAHAGRSGGRAEPDCERLHAGQHEAPAGLAESESAPLDARPAAEAALLAVLARRNVRVTAGDAVVVAAWAAEQVTPLELDGAIDKALDERAKAQSVQPIGVGYVGKIIQSRRSAARKAAAAARAAVTEGRKQAAGEQAFESLARSLGMYPAWPGESWDKWRSRVYAAADQVVSGDGA